MVLSSFVSYRILKWMVSGLNSRKWIDREERERERKKNPKRFFRSGQINRSIYPDLSIDICPIDRPLVGQPSDSLAGQATESIRI